MSSTPKLKIMEILDLHHALPDLDRKMVSDEGDHPYKFDQGTRWNIAKNIRVIREAVEIYEEQRVAKVKELSPKNLNVAKEDQATQEQFTEWQKGVMRTEVEVPGLLRLKRSKLLNGDANPIPGTVLAAIMPIVDDDGEQAPKPA